MASDAQLGNFLADDEEERKKKLEDPYSGQSPLMSEAFLQRQSQIKTDRAERERLASVPYGTPQSAGGTAQHYQVKTQKAYGDGGPNGRLFGDGTATITATAMGADGLPLGRTASNSGIKDYFGIADEGALYVPGKDLTSPGSIDGPRSNSPGATGSGDPLSQLGDVEVDAGARSDDAKKGRTNALQDVIDRYDSVNLETGQADASRVAQNEAIRMNRELFDKANNYDREAAAEKFSENALASSLAVARSAPGGAGREEALFNALSSMPAIQAEGLTQANEEGRSQELQALRAAGQLGQQATQTRSLDQQQAETKSSIGLDVARGIQGSIDHNLDLDARDREFLGEVALAVARLNLDWETMDVQQQEAALQRALQREGLDQEWKVFKEGQQINERDVLGGILSIGGGVISGVATGGAA